MDGLLIKKEYLDLIFEGKKDIEIRMSNTSKRGKIALIESGTGLIIGTVNLRHTSLLTKKTFRLSKKRHWLKEMRYKNNWGWWFFDAEKFKEPIKYKHPQGAQIWVRNVL